MKKVSTLLIFDLIFLCTQLTAQQTDPFSSKDFFNNPPTTSNSAKLYMPHFISTGLNEFNAVFTPQLDEIYFSIRHRSNYFVILMSKSVEGIIKTPQIASFSGTYQDADPFITSEGKYLYFCSDRPVDNNDTLRDWNIWRLKRDGKEWVEIELLPFNSHNKSEMYPTVANNGNVYFHADYESPSIGVDFTKTDIYMSKLDDITYSAPVKLSEICSSELSEWDPFISPSEDFLIFSSPRPDGFGSGDMYISFYEDGKWSSPTNMGPVINSPAMDYCASLSPDGKYLFFSSYKSLNNIPQLPVNYEELTRTFNGPQNGYGDIYWIQSSIIDELR